MQRPDSPISIDDIGKTFDQTLVNDSHISREDFYDMARIGFNNLKDKLQKTTINTGDALSAFWDYNVDSSADDDMCMMTSYYCLAVIMLINKKSYFDGIDSTIYNKLAQYTLNKYNEMIIQYE